MATKRSNIFLNFVTCIDHAYIDQEGVVSGGSVHPNFIISGDIDPTEQVVIDFSTVKKLIKQTIDDKETGFDHKLWLIDQYSNYTYTINEEQKTISIQTPAVLMDLPLNAVKFTCQSDNTVSDHIAREVQQKLNEVYPNSNIEVKLELTSVALSRTSSHENVVSFKYVHGLKNSTSWGCQNLHHGHLSWAEFDIDQSITDEQWEHPDTQLALQQIVENLEKMDNKILIFSENILLETEESITIGYTTERGQWCATYEKDKVSYIVLDEETTIENILDAFVNENIELLKQAHICRLDISEGLSKGATWLSK